MAKKKKKSKKKESKKKDTPTTDTKFIMTQTEFDVCQRTGANAEVNGKEVDCIDVNRTGAKTVAGEEEAFVRMPDNSVAKATIVIVE